MINIDSSLLVSLTNAIVYTIVLAYWYFRKGFSVGIIIWSLFALSAWFTFLFIQQPLYSTSIHYCVLTFTPYIYLFTLLYICINPLSRLYPLEIESIAIGKKRMIHRYMIFMCIIQIASILVDFPMAVNVMTTSQIHLADYRDAAYGSETNVLSWTIPVLAQLKGWIQSPLSVINNALIVILPFCLKEKSFLIKLFVISTIMHTLTTAIITVSRGELFLSFILWMCLSILFIRYMNKKTILTISILVSIFLFVFIPFVITISVSRFGDNAYFFLFKYFGEPMNNFNGLMWPNLKGTTAGRAYFSFIYSLLGESNFSNTEQKWALIEQYTNVSGQYFYTFIGGFIFEFGKLIPIFIAFFFNRLLYRMINRQLHLDMGTLLILVIFIDFYIRGIFLFSWQGSTILGLFYVMIIYCYFQKDIYKQQKYRTKY